MKRKQARIKLGAIGHFCLAVKDPKASARWWRKHFDLEEIFRGKDSVGLSNEAVTIVWFKGRPHPETLEHMSFHLSTMSALRAALKQLKAAGVALEDPGDEIGPEASGSANMGLWFHDEDGYRWELSVLSKSQPRG
jgi:catechol 2,3-dioxygenase-like lactoylglutathione lyase family enzyme